MQKEHKKNFSQTKVMRNIDHFIAFLQALVEEIDAEIKAKGELFKNKPSFKVGDRLELVDKVVINYFIDEQLDIQVSTNHNPVSDAITDLFLSSEIYVVTAADDVKKVYKCGHCEHDHEHDLLVHFVNLKRNYYAPSDAFKLLNP